MSAAAVESLPSGSAGTPINAVVSRDISTYVNFASNLCEISSALLHCLLLCSKHLIFQVRNAYARLEISRAIGQRERPNCAFGLLCSLLPFTSWSKIKPQHSQILLNESNKSLFTAAVAAAAGVEALC